MCAAHKIRRMWPVSGRTCGGEVLTLTGSALGNGSDVSTVEVCDGAAATILWQTSTQVVVLTPTLAPGAPSCGVRVWSDGRGWTPYFAQNFTYGACVRFALTEFFCSFAGLLVCLCASEVLTRRHVQRVT